MTLFIRKKVHAYCLGKKRKKERENCNQCNFTNLTKKLEKRRIHEFGLGFILSIWGD